MTRSKRASKARAAAKAKHPWTEDKPKPAPPKGFRKRPLPFKVELQRGVEAFDQRLATRPKLTKPPKIIHHDPDPHHVRDRQSEAQSSTHRGAHDTRSLSPRSLFDRHPADAWRD